MVCCFAALQYTGCMHRSVFKIDCTRDCEGRCEPQELILEALVCVPCERCLEARADRRILERALIVKRAELLALELQEAQEGGAPCPPHFLYMTRTRVHENLEVASVEFAARLARASYAESWTFEVAELVWQLKHGKCKDVAAVKRKLNQLMKMSTWNLKVISKSSWTRDAVDSSEESNAAATNEDHNVGVTESAGTSADSLATTSISSTADRELMPLPPLSIGTRPPRTNRSGGELIPPPPSPARARLPPKSPSPSWSALQPSSQMPIQTEPPESNMSMSPPSSILELAPHIPTEAESSPRSEASQSPQASTSPILWQLSSPLTRTRV